MSEGAESRLAALVDGAPLPEDEARALWKAFSEHMDANKGDMAGFAAKKGWTSVAPEFQGGKAVLMVWTHTAPPPPAAPPKNQRRAKWSPRADKRSKPKNRPR